MFSSAITLESYFLRIFRHFIPLSGLVTLQAEDEIPAEAGSLDFVAESDRVGLGCVDLLNCFPSSVYSLFRANIIFLFCSYQQFSGGRKWSEKASLHNSRS